ncbi:MAG: protein-glutamate O-methyltransferase [Desulfobacteraceae bacterium]|jgi:chemotaxis protein methyltransferase CheR
MNDTIRDAFSRIELTGKDFKRLASFIHERLGIKVPDFKRSMIESRLRKRLNVLGLKSYTQYCDFLFSGQGMDQELSEFTDVITTNKTDFFREPHHFKFIQEKALPDLVENTNAGVSRKLMAWSCACSRGDEPYTLAMVLSDYGETRKRFDFSILATDISTRMLETAVRGIYEEQVVEPVPPEFKKKYLLRSKDRTRQIVRIKPEIRKRIKFHRLNLMNSDFGLSHKMDILFCRNVIIYFDKPTTEKLIARLCDNLAPGGYLFMGHSELLDVNRYPLVPVAPTIYQKIKGR